MSDIGPIKSQILTPVVSQNITVESDETKGGGKATPDVRIKVEESTVVKAAANVQAVVNSVSETTLSFSVDNELSRMVVTVTAVGSDEIVRQFPPEEFMTVAKFIAAQNPDSLDENFLKGILFDQHT